MNVLNKMVAFYGLLHEYKGIPNILFTPLRRAVRFMAKTVLPKRLAKLYPYSPVVAEGVVVSLTSFPDRISNVWQVVACMKRQTVRPEKIFLWLSEDQFPTKRLPDSLLDIEDEVFQVKWVKGDIRSHKKYFYVSQQFPDSWVVLVDDDIYYPTNLIERMLAAKGNRQHVLVCNFGYLMRYNSDGVVMPYSCWIDLYQNISNDDIFFGSGGGTMFKPSDMYNDLLDSNLFLSLTPNADDVWLNAMAQLGGIECIMLKNGIPLPVAQSSSVSLYSNNVGQCGNDKQIDAVRQHYQNKVFVKPRADK
ncbi:MAG: hypothetical protein KBT04_04520, partial [Bacteroidales bacterium]|nr:hypothetical protein [Candidatus Colimorpha onthohippi]